MLQTETKKFNKKQVSSGFGVCNLSQVADLPVFEDQPNGHKGQFGPIAVINGKQSVILLDHMQWLGSARFPFILSNFISQGKGQQRVCERKRVAMLLSIT